MAQDGFFQRLKTLARVGPRPAQPLPAMDSPEAEQWESRLHPELKPSIPALPIEHLLRRHDALIQKVYQVSRATREEFDERYMDVIRRYAQLVHLLPASGDDHHQGWGGLFRHGLEVGFNAVARATTGSLFDGAATGPRRKQIESVWPFACFVGGICHDIGKPISDMHVTSPDGSVIWQAHISYILDWCQVNALDRYRVAFISNRDQHHLIVGPDAINRVVSEPLKALITEVDANLWIDVRSCVVGVKTSNSRMGDIVHDADLRSVKVDKAGRDQKSASLDSGKDALFEFMNAAKNLIREGRWQVNANSRVWVMHKALFLAWPWAAEDVARWMIINHIKGVNYEPSKIAQMLKDREALVPYKQKNGAESLYWLIRPDSQKSERPLRCICLANPQVLYELPPPSCGGVVVEPEVMGEGAAEASQPNPPANSGAPPDTAQDARPEPAAPPPPSNAAPPKLIAPPPAIVTDPMVPTEAPPPTKTRAERQRARDAKLPQSAEVLDAPNTRNWFNQQPAIGQVIVAVCEDVQLHDDDPNSRRQHAGFRQARVVLRWPEALKGYGLESREILTKLKDAGWIEPNPYQLTQFLRDDVGFSSAIVFSQEISRRLITLAPVLLKLTPANLRHREEKKNPALPSPSATVASRAPVPAAKSAPVPSSPPPSREHALAPASPDPQGTLPLQQGTEPHRATLADLLVTVGALLRSEVFSNVIDLNESVRVPKRELRRHCVSAGFLESQIDDLLESDRSLTQSTSGVDQMVDIPKRLLRGPDDPE